MPRHKPRRRPSRDTLLLDLKQDLAIANANVSSMMSEQSEARESRHLMHEKLDGMRSSVLTHSIMLERIAPLVDKHEELYQQSAGRRRLFGGLLKLRHLWWGAIITGLGYLGYHLPKP